MKAPATAALLLTLTLFPWPTPAGPAQAQSAPAPSSSPKETPAAERGPDSGAAKPRLKRSASYFGLHYDFHAGDDCNEIGKTTTREMIERIIDAAQPDYIQVDTKGHRGLSSYPTKVGNPAPGFVGDQLRLWRQVTSERGVSLYVHHSGVWDSEAIVKHPDWAVVNADGSRNKNATSFWSPYADQLLVPQLRELAVDYGIDGAWVDGECWAAQPDFGAAALDAFTKSTGQKVVPRGAKDPGWFEFLEFNRNAFRQYLRRYIAAVRSARPSFELCSNWAFSDHMPEVVSADVDWISGDFSPEDAVNSARFSARYLVHQGKPWDLMAWGFVTKGIRPNGDRQKSAAQLEREAAVVLSQGGGFQVYHNQRRDGSVPLENLPILRELARFCRERQPFCQGAKPVPQVAFLYSTASHYREAQSLFGRDLSNLQGSLQALIEGGQVVDIVSEHSLSGHMKDYPLIVIGETKFLEPAFRRELLDYATGGGRLLLLGPDTASLFAGDLGLTLGEPSNEARDLAWHLGPMGILVPTTGPWRDVQVPEGARVVAPLHSSAEAGAKTSPAALVLQRGQGQIAVTLFSASRGYLANRSPVTRAFLTALASELFPNPLARVVSETTVDLCVMRQGKRLAVHLVNCAGAHWDQEHPLFDTIPVSRPVKLEIRCETRPTSVRLEPAGKALPFEYRDGRVSLIIIPGVEIHSIVTVE